jgi:hypothetical protein
MADQYYERKWSTYAKLTCTISIMLSTVSGMACIPGMGEADSAVESKDRVVFARFKAVAIFLIVLKKSSGRSP